MNSRICVDTPPAARSQPTIPFEIDDVYSVIVAAHTAMAPIAVTTSGRPRFGMTASASRTGVKTKNAPSQAYKSSRWFGRSVCGNKVVATNNSETRPIQSALAVVTPNYDKSGDHQDGGHRKDEELQQMAIAKPNRYRGPVLEIDISRRKTRVYKRRSPRVIKQG